MRGTLDLFDAVGELAERDRVLALHARLRKEYLTAIREHMRTLYARRLGIEWGTQKEAYVTGDDAREYFEEMDPPEALSRNFLGAVFAPRGWVTDGETVHSAIRGGHGNRIFKWRYVGP